MYNNILYKDFNYITIDDHSKTLLCTLNALPGIKILSSNLSIKDADSKNIFFRVDENSNEGLFFITRCLDKRYWKFGSNWKITVSVGDNYHCKHLPICYCIESISSLYGEEYNEQILSMIDNFNYHLNLKFFISYYEIDLSKFSITTKTQLERNITINNILQ